MLLTPVRLRYLDPGPLVDHELKLVAPHATLIEPMLDSLHAVPDPLQPNPEPPLSRATLQHIVSLAPNGWEKSGTRHRGSVASYHFWMQLQRQYRPAVSMAGNLSFRVSDSDDTRLYFGHIGYGVFPAARGHHYAERAVRLILPLARQHGMKELWITCNPENAPSRRTCERLGAALQEIINLPTSHVLYDRGERQKCRYLLPL